MNEGFNMQLNYNNGSSATCSCWHFEVQHKKMISIDLLYLGLLKIIAADYPYCPINRS